MEKQPQKGNLLAAEEINIKHITAQERDFLLNSDNVEALIAKSDELQTGPRKLRSLLEAEALVSGYQPNNGSDMLAATQNKKEVKTGRFSKIRRAIGAGVLSLIAFNAAPASAEMAEKPAPIERVVDNDVDVNYYEQILAQVQQGSTDLEQETGHEAGEVWNIEYLTDSKDKRYENNFGPSYEGKMDKASVVADILDRAKKDPAFLAAMTASCGAIEQGDVDACSLTYAGDFAQREAAYAKLTQLLEDENTVMSHFVSNDTFSSTYFSGKKTAMINGEEVTVPKIGYSTNQKVRDGADDRQKYVAKFVNVQQGLDTELRPDCGWQYNIVDETKMVGVPQVVHELQQPKPVESIPEGVTPIYINTIPESTDPIAEIPRISVVTPEAPVAAPEAPVAVPTPDKTPEQPVAVPQPEAPIESEETPDSTPQPETPEEIPEEEPTDPIKEIPVAPTPEKEIDVPTEPVKPTIPVAPTPEPEIEVPVKPVPEVNPPKVIDDSKDWSESRENPKGAPDDNKVNTNENNSLTKDPSEVGNGTKTPDMTGKGQDPRNEVTIKAPQSTSKSELDSQKIDTNDTPIFNELKQEYKKKDQEPALKKENAQVNETKTTQEQTKKFVEGTKVQQGVDREGQKQNSKTETQLDREVAELTQQMAEKAKAKAANAKATPGIKATTPTEVTNEINN